MTLKSIKPANKKTKKQFVAEDSPGFTHSESKLINQLEAKKKVKHVKQTEEESAKVGNMFKKKKKDVSDDEEIVEKPKKSQKVKMDVDEGDFEVVKPSKKTKSTESLSEVVVPGFSAPKKAAPKRKHEGEEGPAKKTKKVGGEKSSAFKKKEKEALKVERKTKENENRYLLSVKAKKLWEELRREDTTKEKQLSLSADLYGLIKTHAHELVFAHDTARVIECLFEKASQDIREAVFNELKPHTINLAKSQYAHFYLMKVLRHGNKEQRTYVIQALSGKVVFLMKHKFASKVVETAYNDWANASQRALLSQEFYGPEFKLFKDESITTLSAALAKHPEKKEVFLKHMNQAIEPIIAKGVFNHSLLHRLTNEYLTHCSENERSEMIQSLRQAVIQVLHTRDGARVGLTCIWYGTQKDRKDIIKSFKGHVTKICQEEHGHMVLMALFDSVDDTKLVAKAIVSEIATSWREIVVHEHGRKVVMYLLAGRDPKYTHPQIIDILKQGDGNPNSKKDMATRHKELLQYASPAWLEAVAHEPEMWLKDSKNCLVLGSILKFCVGNELQTAFKAVASVIGNPLDQDLRNAFSSDGEKVQHWVEQSAVHMVVKKLVQFDKFRTQPPYFSQAIIDEVDAEEIKGWLSCNRAAFLLVNMVETEIDSVTQAVLEKLKNLRKFLQKQTNKGANILDSKLSKLEPI
ncbi:pumilio homolog 3-like [Daphnia carinata]|uniref:pumilio homolog 3-like n=1 Tax=Daphnia carinata TaxID=120202 RepID=UPI00257FEB78|nr:pumilio homolog 3-like [Daphnia carinata]